MAEAVSKRATSTAGAKVDPPECSVSASRHFGKGNATPEKRVISSFDTASAGSRQWEHWKLAERRTLGEGAGATGKLGQPK